MRDYFKQLFLTPFDSPSDVKSIIALTTQDRLKGKIKEVLKPLEGLIIKDISKNIEEIASEGKYKYTYSNKDLSNKQYKCLQYYYNQLGFKTYLVVVNSGYKNQRIEALTISWMTQPIKQLEFILQ